MAREVFGFAVGTVRYNRATLRGAFSVILGGWIDDEGAGREKGRELRSDLTAEEARFLAQRLNRVADEVDRQNGKELPAAQGGALPALPEGIEEGN